MEALSSEENKIQGREAKWRAFWALEEGDGSGIHWGHHLPSRTGKDRAGICGRELVTGVWEQEGTSSA